MRPTILLVAALASAAALALVACPLLLSYQLPDALESILQPGRGWARHVLRQPVDEEQQGAEEGGSEEGPPLTLEQLHVRVRLSMLACWG